jgi:hypothetical protein
VRVKDEGKNIYAICNKVEVCINKYNILVTIHLKDIDSNLESFRCFTIDEFGSNVSIISSFHAKKAAKSKGQYVDAIDETNESSTKNKPVNTKKTVKPTKKEDAPTKLDSSVDSSKPNKKRKSVKPKNNK